MWIPFALMLAWVTLVAPFVGVILAVISGVVLAIAISVGVRLPGFIRDARNKFPID